MRKGVVGISLVILCVFFMSSFLKAQNVKLTEVEYHGTGSNRIEMPMSTVYFEMDCLDNYYHAD